VGEVLEYLEAREEKLWQEALRATSLRKHQLTLEYEKAGSVRRSLARVLGYLPAPQPVEAPVVAVEPVVAPRVVARKVAPAKVRRRERGPRCPMCNKDIAGGESTKVCRTELPRDDSRWVLPTKEVIDIRAGGVEGLATCGRVHGLPCYPDLEIHVVCYRTLGIERKKK
jgi:hypothetical protein